MSAQPSAESSTGAADQGREEHYKAKENAPCRKGVEHRTEGWLCCRIGAGLSKRTHQIESKRNQHGAQEAEYRSCQCPCTYESCALLRASSGNEGHHAYHEQKRCEQENANGLASLPDERGAIHRAI